MIKLWYLRLLALRGNNNIAALRVQQIEEQHYIIELERELKNRRALLRGLDESIRQHDASVVQAELKQRLTEKPIRSKMLTK